MKTHNKANAADSIPLRLICDVISKAMKDYKDIKKKISDWLKTQGYPLEMHVASALRNTGFDVQIAHYYSDPENGTIREIDVVASYPEYTGALDVSFVIECKVSKKKAVATFFSRAYS